MPDFRFSVDTVLDAGDRIAWRGTVQGTLKGEFGGIPPTGKAFSTPVAEFYQLVDGQIQEAWVYLDMLSLLQQVGVIPVPDEVPA